MEWLFLLVIVCSTLGAIARVVIAARAAREVQKLSTGLGQDQNVEQLLRALEQVIATAQRTQGALPPAMQQQFSSQSWKLDQALRHSEQMGRERVELRKAELMSMAANAGLTINL